MGPTTCSGSSRAIESVLTFYPRFAWEFISKSFRFLSLYWKYYRIERRVEKDPAKREYMDLAIKPVQVEELDELEIFNVDESAKRAAEKARLQVAGRA